MIAPREATAEQHARAQVVDALQGIKADWMTSSAYDEENLTARDKDAVREAQAECQSGSGLRWWAHVTSNIFEDTAVLHAQHVTPPLSGAVGQLLGGAEFPGTKAISRRKPDERSGVMIFYEKDVENKEEPDAMHTVLWKPAREMLEDFPGYSFMCALKRGELCISGRRGEWKFEKRGAPGTIGHPCNACAAVGGQRPCIKPPAENVDISSPKIFSFHTAVVTSYRHLCATHGKRVSN